jgi:hypothetical protein
VVYAADRLELGEEFVGADRKTDSPEWMFAREPFRQNGCQQWTGSSAGSSIAF